MSLIPIKLNKLRRGLCKKKQTKPKSQLWWGKFQCYHKIFCGAKWATPVFVSYVTDIFSLMHWK